jgi:hypothetical protein
MSRSDISQIILSILLKLLKTPPEHRQYGLFDYVGLGMYREWKKIEFPEEYCI